MEAVDVLLKRATQDGEENCFKVAAYFAFDVGLYATAVTLVEGLIQVGILAQRYKMTNTGTEICSKGSARSYLS